MLKQNYTYGPGLPKNTDLGVFGPDLTVVFKTVSRLSLSLQTGRWLNTLSANYKSGYTDINHVGDGAVFLADPNNPNGFGAKAVSVTFGIKNLSNKAPPLSLQNAGGGNQQGYDGRYADPIGRSYYVRAKFKF
jgi:iron complex outermembrane recepter protein